MATVIFAAATAFRPANQCANGDLPAGSRYSRTSTSAIAVMVTYTLPSLKANFMPPATHLLTASFPISVTHKGSANRQEVSSRPKLPT